MKVLARITFIGAVLVIMHTAGAFAIWQCGNVDLDESPDILIMDPVTRDIFDMIRPFL